jgi:hypothetical protein
MGGMITKRLGDGGQAFDAANGVLDPDADAGFLGVYKSLPSRQVAAFRLFWGWITASWG